ncbi:MAG: hypothetical protein Q8N83_17730 [Ignavibacteria bacterium]|nr:hypothetical protein [Ignavibacteria bacterium]
MISADSSFNSKHESGKFRVAFLLLFALAIFLLLLNIILSFFAPKEITYSSVEISANEINQLFKKSVDEFYLGSAHLKKIKSPKKKEDSLLFSYRLTLPYDVPVPVLLNSVFDNFRGKDVEINSTEMVLNKKSILEISSGGKEKFYAELIQDTSLHRDNGSLAFVLTDYENLSADDLNKLLTTPESFAFLLQPEKGSAEFTKTILDFRKEYIVELTASSPNSEFTLAENFPIVRNKLAINSLLRYYPKNTFFFVNQQSTLLNSNAYEKVRKEFSKKKYNLFSSNSFTNLSELKHDECEKHFFAEVSVLRKGEVKLTILPANYFLTSIDKIAKIKKRGVRFIPATKAVLLIKGQ